MTMQDLPNIPHWPAGVPRTLAPARTPLWANLETSARRHPDRAALVFLGREFRYGELWQAVLSLAGRLHRLGVRQGDRVLLDMQNCPQLVIAHFAILRANAVVVPINPMNKAQELRHFIADAQAKLAFTTADLAAEMVRASDALPPGEGLDHLVVTRFTDAFDPAAVPPHEWPVAWREWLTAPHPMPALRRGQVHDWADAASGDEAPAPTCAAGDLAALPYTSGTTGHPKGCMLSHAAIMHNAMAVKAWNGLVPESVNLAVVPMFHITGMVGVMHAAIHAGACSVLMPRWDREVAAHLLSARGVTHWANIPTMVIDLMSASAWERLDLSRLAYIGGGGAAMPKAVAQGLLEKTGLRYVEAYGLTETAAPSHSNPPDAARQQCLGLPYIGVDARVIDPQTLQPLGPEQDGEIVVRGPQVFAGYWRQPEATRAAFVEIEGLRFFRTGDIGRVDADGYFFMTDRLKRMINASGFKVWPAEVEALMYRHPGIQEACVIATRDSYRGESVKAVVVRRPGHAELDERALIDWCRANMASYKVPRAFEFAETLPKSGSGKVMWRLLQERQDAADAAC
nr:long-chain-fatty-acid--CoA ligase [Variovorax sp. CY25R-8]